MAALGNTWHIPASPEPRGVAGMRDPVFPTTDDPAVAIVSGNQFQGAGNPGNQLQDGSAVLFRGQSTTAWTSVPMAFVAQVDDNKYFSASLPITGLAEGTVVAYYLRIAYDDHDVTFLAAAADGTTSTAVADEAAAQAAPFPLTIDTAAKRGRWDPPFPLPNVAIHAHVLLSGKVLMWGRRDTPDQSLDADPPSPLRPNKPAAPSATCTPFLLDPETLDTVATPQPTLVDGRNADLFCSGHAWLADGRLLVAGGHRNDSDGLKQTTVYDPGASTWTPGKEMTDGRWYPSLATLADGSVLILGGSYRATDKDRTVVPVTRPEVWADGADLRLLPAPDAIDSLYPRLHLTADGTVVITGSQVETRRLAPRVGTWSDHPARPGMQREYAPSVLYDRDRVLYVGGGSPPTADAYLLDLTAETWGRTKPMAFPRRQHNATILADGTVLVTGGTRGGGSGPPQDFNNLDPGQPVHVAELWDPQDPELWLPLAGEAADRCYHSIAVLLPDARVLSAGGGEFFPREGVPEQNDPADSHRDAQIFTPPYLCKDEPRPQILEAPGTIEYGQSFAVAVDAPGDVARVTLIGLSSVTHSFNTGQRFLALAKEATADGLMVTAPEDANAAPPGPYMLFVISDAGVPSHAALLLLGGGAQAAPAPSAVATEDVLARRARVLATTTGTRAAVGLRGTCPYGIGACWGGAYEALRQMPGVADVDPVPDARASTATVFLDGERLPDLANWRERLRALVGDAYKITGVELRLSGELQERDGALVLAGGNHRPDLTLKPLHGPKVQQDIAPRRTAAASAREREAFQRLGAATGSRVSVTGPLHQTSGEQWLEVRDVTIGA